MSLKERDLEADTKERVSLLTVSPYNNTILTMPDL